MSRALRMQLLHSGQLGLLTGLILGVQLTFASVNDLWISPEDDLLLGLTGVCVLIGLVLGLLHLLAEQLPSLREWALHRGVSRASQYGHRLAGALLAATLAVTSGFALAAAMHRWLTSEGALIRLEDLRHWWVIGTASWAGVGFAALAAATRGRLAAVALRKLIAFAALIVVEVLVLADAPGHVVQDYPTFVAVQVAVLAAGALAGLGGHLVENELDRPIPPRRLLALLPAEVLAVAVVLAAALPELQHGLIDEALHYPEVARPSAAGAPRLYVGAGDDRVVEVDRGHAPTGEPLPRRDTHTVFSPDSRFWFLAENARKVGTAGGTALRLDAALGTVRWRLAYAILGQVFLRLPEGTIEVVRTSLAARIDPASRGLRPLRLQLEKPDGTAFSPRTEVIHGGGVVSAARELLIGDPGDGTVWRLVLDADRPRLEAAPLPAGDRYTGSRLLEGGSRANSRGANERLVLGLDAAYRWDGERFEPAAGDVRPASRTAAGPDDVSVIFGDTPLEFEVIVHDLQSGEEVFRHAFAPRRPAEHAVAAAVRGLALLRPPPLLLAAHARETPPPGVPSLERHTFGHARLYDPLVLGGQGRTLLLTALLVNALLGAWLWRRLARRGAGARRGLAWGVLPLLLGPSAVLLFALLEPRRAWSALPAELFETAAPPLIVTPRTEAPAVH